MIWKFGYFLFYIEFKISNWWDTLQKCLVAIFVKTFMKDGIISKPTFNLLSSSKRWNRIVLQIFTLLLSGSCHLDRASNVEIGVGCQICVIVMFFNCTRFLKFWAHSRYYKGALTQNRSFLVLCTTFRSDFYVNWKNQN